jgi:nitrogen regulatory protein P-II 1
MNKTIAMKRLEIVIDAEKLYDMIALLDSVGVRGYSFIKSVGGLGSRGERRPDGIFFQQEENAIVILACQEDQSQKVVAALSPKLKEFGGMCLISDCLWVEGPAVSY